MRVPWTRTIGIGFLVLLGGCTLGTDEAKQGVADFRARVSQRAFGDIYATAGPTFQQAVTAEKFVQFMEGLERKLGAWQSAAEPTWNVMRGTNGHFVRLTYQSQFAQGAAAEEFVWQIQNGRPVLAGYHINSSLLVSE